LLFTNTILAKQEVSAC